MGEEQDLFKLNKFKHKVSPTSSASWFDSVLVLTTFSLLCYGMKEMKTIALMLYDNLITYLSLSHLYALLSQL